MRECEPRPSSLFSQLLSSEDIPALVDSLSCLVLNVLGGLWFKHFFNSRQTKDTVNYCVPINKLLELMGDELIPAVVKKQHIHGDFIYLLFIRLPNQSDLTYAVWTVVVSFI